MRLIAAALLAAGLAPAASHPYFEFAQRFMQGQSQVRIALDTQDGPIVYTGVLLQNEPEGIVAWSPDFRRRLSIPHLGRWPLMESVRELDGVRTEGEATCYDASGADPRRGTVLTIDRNPMRALYQLRLGERTAFFGNCKP